MFIEAALTLGITRWRLFWHHVFRNHTLPVLCIEGAVLVGYILLFDAILGFCGVRQRGEVFTWGNLLGTGLDDLTRLLDAGIEANVFVAIGPLLATLITIACATAIGEAIKSLGRSVRFVH
jgi:ABC-type dipeptide/oligopeptide/nickel transport system permease subunit